MHSVIHSVVHSATHSAILFGARLGGDDVTVDGAHAQQRHVWPELIVNHRQLHLRDATWRGRELLTVAGGSGARDGQARAGALGD